MNAMPQHRLKKRQQPIAILPERCSTSADIDQNDGFTEGHCLDSIWLDITRLGESGFLMPIGAALPLWFLINRSYRLALLWTLAFGLGVSLVVLSKVAFLGWGIGIRSINFTGFSGHTMLAASVFPTLAWLVLGQARSVVRDVLVAVAVALAAVVALSRVELGAHSISEVVTGFMLGAAVSISFVALAKRQPNARVPAALVLVALVASALLGMGHVTPSSHRVIASMALWASGHQRTYHRDQWLLHEDYQET